MTENNLLDAMLHPTRMRIMMTLAGTEGMTPLQLAEVMPEVPQATLYRHINKLAENSILTVAQERRVRGTIEKVYALNTSARTHLTADEIQNLSKEEHMYYFNAFLVTLMEEFSGYLRSASKVDYAADGVGYSQVVLYMDENELMEFSQKMNEALLPFAENKNADEPSTRRKRIFSTVLMPASDDLKQK